MSGRMRGSKSGLGGDVQGIIPAMNALLDRLQPYPFERLRQLFAGVAPSPAHKGISLGIGEPRHATPPMVMEVMNQAFSSLAAYPPTAGDAGLRQACAQWLADRYQVKLDSQSQILPVNGSREALFSFAQAVINPHAGTQRPWVVCPNPFYQIYEGAALLGGADVITCHLWRNAILRKTGPACPRPCGPRPNCCLCARRATPRVRSCPCQSGNPCLS